MSLIIPFGPFFLHQRSLIVLLTFVCIVLRDKERETAAFIRGERFDTELIELTTRNEIKPDFYRHFLCFVDFIFAILFCCHFIGMPNKLVE